MDDEELRLECLKLCGNDTEKAADRFDFIKRRGKYSSGALKVETPSETSKARVVGRDGDLEPRFKDYLREDDK